MVGFVIAIVYATASVGAGGTTIVTTQNSCTVSTACPSFSITSAKLVTVNYTDELGPVGYAVLTLGITTSGTGQIGSVTLFVGNLSAGSIQGPFGPGTSKTINMTLPSTIAVTAGKSYLVSIEGQVANESEVVWESAEVTAT